MRPFLKWAGNKYKLMSRISAVLPDGRRLVEPFVGSGAVFLNTEFPAYRLADANPDLINLYRMLQREGQSFIDDCRRYFTPAYNAPEAYYALRARFNETTDIRLRALLFVYFNRHGYNGLCRYNAGGKFNVPFGRYARPYFPEREMLEFHRKSARAEFIHASFETIMRSVIYGDVVYCDPPYVPLSGTAHFTAYSPAKFGLDEQRALAREAERLSAHGIPVVISNHHTEFTQRVYRAADVTTFDVRRNISCDSANRNKVTELLAVFA